MLQLAFKRSIFYLPAGTFYFSKWYHCTMSHDPSDISQLVRRTWGRSHHLLSLVISINYRDKKTHYVPSVFYYTMSCPSWLELFNNHSLCLFYHLQI